ncbi:MAG: hypothetical protein ACREIV_13465, partial [Planctomycetaceae bacterium]
MSARRRSLLSIVTAFVLVAAACGSTVPLEEQEAAEAAAAQGLSDGGLGVAGSDGLGSGTGSGSGVGGSGSGLAGTGTGSASGSGSGPAAAGSGGVGAGGVAAGANGPGITATEIKIGFAYPEDSQQTNDALGGSGATQINYPRAYDAMVEYVNKDGGIDGRKIVPVYDGLQTA